MKRSRLSRHRHVAWLLCVSFMMSASADVASADGNLPTTAASSNASPKAPVEERMEFEPILIALVQDHLAKEERLPGQQAIVIPKIWYNEEGDAINIDLGRAYLPTHYTMTFEERVNEIANILYYTKKPTEIYRVDVWFDGKDIFDYFPEERGPQDRVISGSKPQAKRRSKRELVQRKVLVAAGHGVYYNSKYKDWRAQRDSSNQIVEDFITPQFARRLNKYLIDRSDAQVFQARSSEITRHPDSGMPWSSMAARYHLKSVLPERADIWGSTGQQSAAGMEERDQDIRSRPLYANYLGVDAAIHLHTNAHTPDTRGIEVFYHEKSPQSKRLGDLALCYMKESLSSKQIYANFPIARASKPRNHGENRLADVPSIIAELGFHTNAEDAVAIQGASFQDLTMRGLEKAYRLFKEGNDCQSFSATNWEVTVTSDSTAQTTVAFMGFPRFPVRYESTVSECPSGIMCLPVSGRFKDPSIPLTVGHSCLTTEPFTMRWNVRFIDADGVTAPVVATMHCKPKA